MDGTDEHLLSTHTPFSRTKLRSSFIRSGKSPNRKTVSFHSEGKKVVNVSDCWQRMQNGCEFCKVKGSTRQFRRVFSLDADLSHIRWSPTNKKPHKAKIPIENIREIRLGKKLEGQLDVQEECSFSIVHGDVFDTLDLIACSPDDANVWVTGLIALTSTKSTKVSWSTLRERWIEGLFREHAECASPNGATTSQMDADAAFRIISRLNPNILPSRIHHATKEIGESQGGMIFLSTQQFVELYKEVATRPEIYFLMVRYANKDYLTSQDLRLFLETEQGMTNVTTDICERIIEMYEPSAEGREHNLLTIDGFTAYLMSPDNVLFDPSHAVVCQDMTRPFRHFFIASSHRTFFLEEQAGRVGTAAIAAALQRAARLIEIDVWDDLHVGGPDGVPVDDVLDTIREFAFERSRYPLFLHVRVHCSLHCQREFVRKMKAVFGRKLFIPSLSDPAPAPAHYQQKIIILAATGTSDMEPTGSNKTELSKEFTDLVAPFACVNVVSDSLLPSLGGCELLSESTSDVVGLSQLTKQAMTLLCPDPLRVDSSNVNPQEYWNVGVQCVCLNYQCAGLMMDLQEGKFAENGGCGYVLKPDVGDPEVPSPPQVLHIRLISAQQLPRPRESTAKGDSADPFIVVEIFGVSADCCEERTKTIRNDSTNPIFEESFQFEISVPQLALVRFLVLDDEFIDDDFIGQYTIPFECIQPGYHHVPLLNADGDSIQYASLFVHSAVTNKRGGGKAKKRGMSVRRKKDVSTGIRTIGIKEYDEPLKATADAIREALNMKEQFETHMVEWEEECGVAAPAPVRQGVRLLHGRLAAHVQNAYPPVSLSSVCIDVDDNEMPVLPAFSQFPEQICRPFSKLSEILQSVTKIVSRTADLMSKMNSFLVTFDATEKEFSAKCSQKGLLGQKAIRAGENFIWNLRVIKTQIKVLEKLKEEADDVIEQVLDSAEVLGMATEKVMNRTRQL